MFATSVMPFCYVMGLTCGSCLRGTAGIGRLQPRLDATPAHGPLLSQSMSRHL